MDVVWSFLVARQVWRRLLIWENLYGFVGLRALACGTKEASAFGGRSYGRSRKRGDGIYRVGFGP